MIERLLGILRGGGGHRVDDLARALDATPELVEMMLEDLCRMGYLQRAGGGCAGACGACPTACLCAAGSGGRVWVLREGGA